uniref:Uncharacterized protein n=1 Tax=Spongospora subterranea TaxID=70186 RepID=A0A0H5QQ86_9EUKA|eukprot:CRZ04245.1 hypothetical protein [Spongospora subterranea]
MQTYSFDMLSRPSRAVDCLLFREDFEQDGTGPYGMKTQVCPRSRCNQILGNHPHRTDALQTLYYRAHQYIRPKCSLTLDDFQDDLISLSTMAQTTCEECQQLMIDHGRRRSTTGKREDEGVLGVYIEKALPARDIFDCGDVGEFFRNIGNGKILEHMLILEKGLLDMETRIYIRQCYIDILNRIKGGANGIYRYVITGSSGIGKSLFALYCIYCLYQEYGAIISNRATPVIIRLSEHDDQVHQYSTALNFGFISWSAPSPIYC